jgi:hypothetical protein
VRALDIVRVAGAEPIDPEAFVASGLMGLAAPAADPLIMNTDPKQL